MSAARNQGLASAGPPPVRMVAGAVEVARAEVLE